MPRHGTASPAISGPYIEFQSAVLKALPRDIDDKLALKWANSGEVLSQNLRSFLIPEQRRDAPTVQVVAEPQPQVQFSQVPEIGEWFELEIDGVMDPMLVVTNAGFEAQGWGFLGPAFPGKRVRAKLLDLGYMHNREKAVTMVRQNEPTCVLAPGQARDPFADKFPQYRGRPVVFGGNDWQCPHLDRRVACLNSLDKGLLNRPFRWPDNSFDEGYLWLVVESPWS